MNKKQYGLTPIRGYSDFAVSLDRTAGDYGRLYRVKPAGGLKALRKLNSAEIDAASRARHYPL
jgi:hypothetical protein